MSHSTIAFFITTPFFLNFNAEQKFFRFNLGQAKLFLFILLQIYIHMSASKHIIPSIIHNILSITIVIHCYNGHDSELPHPLSHSSQYMHSHHTLYIIHTLLIIMTNNHLISHQIILRSLLLILTYLLLRHNCCLLEARI